MRPRRLSITLGARNDAEDPRAQPVDLDTIAVRRRSSSFVCRWSPLVVVRRRRRESPSARRGRHRRRTHGRPLARRRACHGRCAGEGLAQPPRRSVASARRDRDNRRACRRAQPVEPAGPSGDVFVPASPETVAAATRRLVGASTELAASTPEYHAHYDSSVDRDWDSSSAPLRSSERSRTWCASSMGGDDVRPLSAAWGRTARAREPRTPRSPSRESGSR